MYSAQDFLTKDPEQIAVLRAQADQDSLSFWRSTACSLLDWKVKPTKNYDQKTWFSDGVINISHNCLDRHILNGLGHTTALVIANEFQDPIKISYQELFEKVVAAAKGLKKLGLKKGDRLILYIPLCLEQAVMMLACARIGVIHSVVYAGFSAEALADRITESQAGVLCAATGTYRGGKWVDFTETVAKAINQTSCVKTLITIDRPQIQESTFSENLSVTKMSFDQLILDQEELVDPIEWCAAGEPFFILYTSGTTGKPKGIVHSYAGYATYVMTTCLVNLSLQPGKIHWSTADAGWITGHSYTVYGPLMCGATTVLFEGSPMAKNGEIYWELCDNLGVNVLYTAPTIIRMLRKNAPDAPAKYSLSSLELLGSVGEPLNPTAWEWYFQAVGKSKIPVIDTWWQTETGGHMIGGLPQLSQSPGKTGYPFFGIQPHLVSTTQENINQEKESQKGELYITKPWPGMLIGCWNNPEQYQKYWTKEGLFKTGDTALKNTDGSYTILGRNDDVLNIAGVRLGSAEIENVIIKNPIVAEVGVVGKPDELTGESVVAFVVLKDVQANSQNSEELKKSIQKTVKDQLMHVAVPKTIYFVDDVPKTRSGKIKRRILRDRVFDGNLKDVNEEL